jgi:predicted membrane-bound spermidine synthase
LAEKTSLTPWAIAFVEGFSTLAVEVIAMRLAIPVVGSSITLTGVMLGVVLLALSAGYWRGGVLSARWDQQRTRSILARNLLLAAILYGCLGFPFEALLLDKLLDVGLSLPLAIGVSASLLFFAPIYLASQTVPMLAEITNVEGKAGKASGKVLFFSTLGSVAGGVVTPVWLFPNLGVTRSTYVVCVLLVGAAAVMSAGRFGALKILGFGAVALSLAAATQAFAAPRNELFSFDSAYQSIRIVEDKARNGRLQRIQIMNGGRASGVYADDSETSFEYILVAERLVPETKSETVLVVGAAGFTFPRDIARLASVTRVDAVDVDPVVKRVAETQLLRQTLSPKIRFLPLSARYAMRKLRRDGNRYSFAYVDAYFGKGIPDELVTVEFFQDVGALANRTAANVIMDRDLSSAFARNLLASFREAFGGVWLKDTKPEDTDSDTTNMLVINWPAPGFTQWNGSGRPYHDDKNTADRDHVDMLWY